METILSLPSHTIAEVYDGGLLTPSERQRKDISSLFEGLVSPPMQPRKSQLSDIAQMASQFGQVQTSQLSDVAQMASQFGQVQTSQLSDIAQMASHFGQVQTSQLSAAAQVATQLAQVLQAAQRSARDEEIPSVHVSTHSTSEIKWLVYRVVELSPSISWESVRNNLAFLMTLATFIATFAPPVVFDTRRAPRAPDGVDSLEAVEDSLREQVDSLEAVEDSLQEQVDSLETVDELVDEEGEYAVASSRAALRSKPDSRGVIIHTLYHNTAVEKLDESGSWTKIKYRDRLNEETITGWVQTHYLSAVE